MGTHRLFKSVSTGHLRKTSGGRLSKHCCLPTIQVSLTGLDASICTDCYTKGAPTRYEKFLGYLDSGYNPTTIDGDYVIPLNQSLLGSTCEYISTAFLWYYQYRSSTTDASCATGNVYTAAAEIVVVVNPSLQSTSELYIWKNTFFKPEWVAFSSAALVAHGTPITNLNACGGPVNATSDGGTATVTEA